MDIREIHTDITTAYNETAKILIGAMLREPHQYFSYRIPAIWFQDTPYFEIAKGIEAVIEASKIKSYTPTAVRLKTGTDQSTITALLSDITPLDLAYDVFNETHERYVESLCALSLYTMTESGMEVNSATVQEQHRIIRTERLVYREGDIHEDQDIEQWTTDKLDGNDPTYPTTPHLRTMITTKALRHYAPGDLVIIAARPAMGKTQYLCNLLSHFMDLGLPGIVFSMEMTKIQLQQRLLSIRTGVNTLANWKYLTDEEKAKARKEAAVIKESTISIDDKPRPIEELERIARIYWQKHGIKFILVDYLQLIRTSGKKNWNREQEVSNISGRLKSIAKELGVPVIALAQLSRAVETRGGAKIPQLSDLRESGSVEQDADIVKFLYRPAYYNIMEDLEGHPIILDQKTELQIAEVIIAKNRHGKTYTASVHYTPVLGYIDPPEEEKASSSDSWYETVSEPANKAIPAITNGRLKEGSDIPF